MPKVSSYQDTKPTVHTQRMEITELELYSVVYSDESIFLYTAIKSKHKAEILQIIQIYINVFAINTFCKLKHLKV